MKDPRDPRNQETLTWKIAYAQFHPEGLIEIQYEIDGELDMIAVNASYADFDKFMPSDEGKYQDDGGRYCAKFDQFLNLHWLVEDFEGHVFYRVVNCNQIVEEMIHEKSVN